MSYTKTDYRYLTARWVLPVSGEPMRDAIVVIDSQKIVDVLPRETFAQVYGEVQPIDYGNAVISPGLINLHSHIDYSALRLFDTTSGFFSWIQGLVSHAKQWTAGDFMASAMSGAQELALSGTTCVADSSLTGIACSTALARTGLRGFVGLELFGLDYRFADRSWSGWLQKFENLERTSDPDLREAFDNKRIQLTIAPHTPYTVSPELWRKAEDWAAERDLPVFGHLSESLQECRWIAEQDEEAEKFLGQTHHSGTPGEMPPTPWRGHGRTPVEHMHHHGLLNERLLAAHAVHLSDSDIELLQKQKTAIAHCPRSNSRLRNGVARYSDIVRSGIPIGLGTDSAASNDDLDILAEARFAAHLHRTRAPLESSESREFIHQLTLGAAKILRIDEQVGSLEPGKEADIAVFEIDDRARYALENPYDLLLYGACKLRDLFVAGRQVVENGALLESRLGT